MAKRRQELTLMWFRQGRMRYVFRMLECRTTDWAWRARWAEKALAFWAEDERDFGYDLPHYRNHMLFELAHARLMARDHLAAFNHYRALAGGRGVRHFFEQGATARRELIECARQLGRAREAEALLVRFDPGKPLSAAECPYRRHAVGLHDTEALVTWQGKLYCFVRFSPPPRTGPRQQEPLCMARLDPVTGERRRWPIEEFSITADVADSVIVRGCVWLATWGQGIFVHDLVTGTWENITVASGLLDNRVGALAVDEAQETIWCAFPSAAASYEVLGERWRTIGHPELKKTFHICPHGSEVWFVRWKGALKVDRRTGAGTFADHQQIPRMPLLQHEGLTYWLSKGRYLFRTDGAGEQVGPTLDAKRVHLGIHPLVAKDRLVFGVDGQIFAADFRKGRVVPLVARHLRAGGICDWRGYSAPMAVMDRVLFVGAGEGFGYDPEGDVGSGWRGPPGGAFGLLSFDMTWLDTGDVAVLPSLLERFAVHGGTVP